jgi:hypothetical protein
VRGCTSRNSPTTPSPDEIDDICSILSLKSARMEESHAGAYTSVNDFMKRNSPFSSAALKEDVLLTTWATLGTALQKEILPRWHKDLNGNLAFKRAVRNAAAVDVLKGRRVVLRQQLSSRVRSDL